MAHFSATPTVAGSGDTIHLGSLEYPALSPPGMRVPLVFESCQAFLFGSLDFVADRLGVLHLKKGPGGFTHLLVAVDKLPNG